MENAVTVVHGASCGSRNKLLKDSVLIDKLKLITITFQSKDLTKANRMCEGAGVVETPRTN